MYFAKVKTDTLAKIYEGYLIHKYNPSNNEKKSTTWMSYEGNCENEINKLKCAYVPKDFIPLLRPCNSDILCEKVMRYDWRLYESLVINLW